MRLLLALSLAMSGAGTALAATSPSVLMEGFSAGLSGLDGRFVQRVFDADGQLTEESQGRVALATPRQFRWEYEDPFPQLIVADGDHVWVYDPDLEQVQVRIQSHEEQQSPLAVLIDPSELERQFDLAGDAESDGLQWVVLTPKKTEEAQFASARLGFAGASLERMQMRDALGQRTEMVFSQWQRNPTFAAGTFAFTPPEGVDVVGEMAESAEVHPIKD
jgi:outer membrane lipoprotein carrier protein